MKTKPDCLIYIFFVLFFFLPFTTLSQNRLFQKEILSSVLSKDGKRLAVSGPDSVYIYSMPGLRLQHKWPHLRNTVLVEAFHPSNPDILITRKRNIPAGREASLLQLDMMEPDRKYWIHPGDSLLVWSVERKEIVQALPGNYYMYFGAGTDKVAGISNGYNAFTANDGRLLNAARGATIFTKNGAQEKESNTAKSIRALDVSENLSHFAASWYQYKSDGLNYSFSIHDFSTHDEVFGITNLPDLPLEFCFSPSGKYLVIAGVWKKDEVPTVKIIDVKTGKMLNEISGLVEQSYDKIFSLSFSADEKQVYVTTKNNWKVFDLLTGAVQIKIEGRLLNLLFIQDAFKVNNQLYLVGSQFNPDGYVTNFGYISSVSNDYLQVYTTVAKAEVKTFADSTAYTMMVNSTLVNNTTPVIRFNPSKTMFTASRDSRLEVWQVGKKKKILELGIDKSIKAYPSGNSKNILVIEDKGSASEGGFTLHNINLANGAISTSPVFTRDQTAMTNSYSNNCISKNASSWYCVDGDAKLWEVSSADFSIKAVAERKGVAFEQIISAADGIYLLGKTDHADTVFKWYNGLFSAEATANDIEHFTVSASNVLLGLKDAPQLETWKDNKLLRRTDLSSPLRHLDLSGDGKYVLVDYSTLSKPGFLKIQEGDKETKLETSFKGGNFYIIGNDHLVQADKGYTSIVNNASYAIPWAVETPQIFSSTNFDVSENGNYLVIDNLLVNLKQVETTHLPKYRSVNLLQDSTGARIVELVTDKYGNNPGYSLRIINLEKKDTINSKEWFKTEEEDAFGGNVHDRLVSSGNKQWAISFTEPSSFKSSKRPKPLLWNLKTLKSITIPVDAVWVDFLPGKNEFIAYDGKQSFHYQANPFQLKTAFDGMFTPNTLATDSLYTTVDFYKILLNAKQGNEVKTRKTFYTKESIQKSLYHSQSKQVFGFAETGKLYVWDVDGSATPKKVLQVHTTPFSRFIQKGDLIYTLTQNGEIGIVSLPDAKLKVVLKLLKKNEELRLAMVTPDGHYKIDQDLINDLHFVKNGEVYPVSSFDLIGNRPDKVYEAIGKADPALIETLEKSWEARIRRLGLVPATLTMTNNRPEVQWNAAALPVVTKNESVQLQYKVSDAVQPLKYVHLRVNGVPIYGRKGLELKQNTKHAEISVGVPLHTGRNNISIVAVNSNGGESIEQVTEVFREVPKDFKPALIYVGIGVSEYADSSMNLRYASKDVADIADYLPAYGDSAVIYTLLDQNATKSNILALKKKLQNTRPDDVVVVSFSGHGTLHKDKGFFFAPHDMNFKHPDEKGISMQMIEDLLDSIPAYKRLLLLDACHSGEESRSVAASKLPEGVSATVVRGSVEEDDQAAAGTDNGYFLMKELFNDLSRGNGAFMISAAASNEFAFEGDKWKNGVFTKSFLEALGQLRYSGFSGRQPVNVKNLRKLIYDKVTTLTNGLQNPTSRQENGWWNWSF